MKTQTAWTARNRIVEGWSEAEFQSEIIGLARALGWVHYHAHDSRRSPSGFPDLVLVHPRRGEIIYRELKTMKGRVSDAQRHWLEILKAAKQDADVWRPCDWTNGNIAKTLTGSRNERGN